MTTEASQQGQAPPWFSTADITAAVSPGRARELIEKALVSAFDPATDPARMPVHAGDGHLLIMPSVIGDWTGTMVASVSPGNPERGLPRIQATYVLMDTQTLTPRALMHGDGLTSLRTPAVSAVAADHLAHARTAKLVVFGTGPQALGHLEAFAAIRQFQDVVVVGRQPESVQAAVAFALDLEMPARAGQPEDVTDADVIVCATSSPTPLFDGTLVKDAACVVAMGSHEPERRELDAALMGRAQVVVEDTVTALREAGDVVLAINDGTVNRQGLVNLVDVVNHRVEVDFTRPRVFKGVGMSWQDLAAAGGVFQASSS
ncbi:MULTISPECIES: ornithine cyclodeaminase family protein [Kocuria]|uniref:Ornithine cyclodeaminase family protein n=1 Tax=Kocuria subflava TaxID=1736139 RepID=A0A846U1T4_9MICC|nr:MULTISPECIES: ornithine cyclodeaminase family protein [Kocuria]NKE08681.1 ornithine cyclodeaminase family protein [Kocuria subflava]